MAGPTGLRQVQLINRGGRIQRLLQIMQRAVATGAGGGFGEALSARLPMDALPVGSRYNETEEEEAEKM
jgi:hypothetical protein